MSNTVIFLKYAKNFKYKNYYFLIDYLYYREYTCNVCNLRKYDSIERGIVIKPFKDIRALGFKNSTFCSSCANAFIDNPDKFVFEYSLGLLTKT